MAKTNRKVPSPAAKVETKLPETPPVAGSRGWSLYDFKVQAIIVSILTFTIYFNSFFNEFAHDDGIVIVKNEYVLEGFAGIPNILTKDAYDSYYRQLNTANQLKGGRYRPLSIVTFAIEQQFFGAVPEDMLDSVMKKSVAYGVRGPQEKKLVSNMHVRHVVNVLIYIASLIILLYFLRYVIFKNNVMMAFIATIIFAIHPIHTEVVANVKSRDEIMSLLFILLTFIFTFKYMEHKNVKMLIAAMVSYFLAFLSKEYAITLVVLLPMALYIFHGSSIKDSVKTFLPFILVTGVYLLLRHATADATASAGADQEVLNNPYLFVSSYAEKLATEIATSLNYLRLLLFPHPLSADYSYNSIPYKDFSNPLVWLSIVVHGGLIVLMIRFFPRRQTLPSLPSISVSQAPVSDYRGIFSFAIAFYLLHLALICNIFFDIGATMGERLIYHSSLGFAIVLAWLIVKGAEQIKNKTASQIALAGIMFLLIIPASYKTIARNADWKNDATLFSADIKTVPNSVLVCANVAASYITKADYEKDTVKKEKMLHDAITLLDRALSTHPTFVAAYLNRGIAYYKLNRIEDALANMNKVKSLYPSYPTLAPMYKLIGDYYMRSGWDKYGQYGRFAEAVEEFKKGVAVDATNADLWYNMGGAYYSNKQYAEAVGAFQQALKIRPGYTQAQMGMQAARAAMNAPK